MSVASLTLFFLVPALGLRTLSTLPIVPPRCSRLVASAVDLNEAGRQVAEWCVSAGRGQATVAVSGAASLSGVLKDFWFISRSFAVEDGPTGRQCILALPAWEDGKDSKLFAGVLNHLNECTEVCEYLGSSLMVAGRHPNGRPGEDESQAAPCPMLLLRSFRQPRPSESASEDSEYDPYAGVTEDVAEQVSGDVPSDEQMLSETRAWVEAVICKMKVCPFSSTADRAGIPVGGVTYPITCGTSSVEVARARAIPEAPPRPHATNIAGASPFPCPCSFTRHLLLILGPRHSQACNNGRGGLRAVLGTGARAREN